MKTALCFSGHLRFWADGIVSWKEFNADVYVSTWGNGDIQKDFVARYNPVEFLTENQEEKTLEFTKQSEPYIDSQSVEFQKVYNIRSYLSMFYKMWSANELIKGDYDMVIRSRTDLILTDRPSKVELNDNTVYTIVHPDESGFGNAGERYVNDVFMMGTQSVMRRATRCWLNFNQLFERAVAMDDLLGFYNPHALLYEHLKLENLDMVQLPIRWRLRRG